MKERCMIDPIPTTDAILTLAEQLADAAAVETLKWFRTPALLVDNKLESGFDPVTQADKAAEQAMRAVLAAHRPHDAIIGEEAQSQTGTTGFSWVLDPIDGTRGYVSGTPTWGTLIALNDGKAPILGVIDQPYTGERFIGGLGHAFMKRDGVKTPLVTSNTQSLTKAIIFTTYPEVGSKVEAVAFHQVAQLCKLTRYGMDCYAYALLAAGHIDLVIEAGLQAYDIQAPIALVRAAGGVATDWGGGNPMNGGRCICAATPELHAAALKILKHVPLD
ncbi:MAG TPA: histidinol-phosphatase [Rhodobacteraceae bacterium]|nr:histidinol-phosphatase [Paracoccaceae bacterium]